MTREEVKTKKNTVFSLMLLVATAISSFLLVPLITHFLSVEAYGYVGLSLTFVTLSQVLSTAITSMATRYIVVAINQSEMKRGNEYFNSVLVCCMIFAVVIVLVFSILSWFIEDIAVISSEYVYQVRIMLVVMAASLAINVFVTPFVSAQHYSNNLIPYYVMTGLSQLSRVVVTYFYFSCVQPAIYVPYVAALCVDLVSILVFYRFFRKHLGMLTISLKAVSLIRIKEVIISGMWVSINRAGTILLTTFSIYLCNIKVSPFDAGLYSAFAQIQTLFLSLVNSLVSSFVPVLLKSFGTGDISGFFSFINEKLHFVSRFVGVGVAIAIVFSLPFFNLWLGVAIEGEYVVVVIMLLTASLSYPFELLNQGLIIQDRVKISSLLTLALGLLNILLALLMLIFFDMGLLGVAFAQFFASVIRAWLVFPIFISDGYVEEKQKIYKAASSGLLSLIFWLIILLPFCKYISLIESWPVLFLSIFVIGIVAYGLTFSTKWKKPASLFSKYKRS